MPTPRAGYKLADGTKCPGTTTIVGRFKESGGLIHWAWDLGKQGLDYREVRDSAADAGTLAHALIDADIHGRPRPALDADTNTILKAQGAFQSYKDWAQQSNLEVIETEMQLVSEQYRYGGTPDAIGRIGNTVVLLDWKSGNRIYQDALIQMAAYGHLIRECRGMDVQGYHLCRFSKEDGDFAHHYFPDLSDAWRAFQLMREMFELDKVLKRRVG